VVEVVVVVGVEVVVVTGVEVVVVTGVEVVVVTGVEVVVVAGVEVVVAGVVEVVADDGWHLYFMLTTTQCSTTPAQLTGNSMRQSLCMYFQRRKSSE
jgi:hypothetical protein